MKHYVFWFRLVYIKNFINTKYHDIFQSTYINHLVNVVVLVIGWDLGNVTKIIRIKTTITIIRIRKNNKIIKINLCLTML